MENQIQKTGESFVLTDANSFEYRFRYAEKFFKAGCFGSDCKNPEQVFVKIQAGAEMGMEPMESMGSLYIINGKITMWGMALAKRLRDHGWIISYPVSTAKEATVEITKGAQKHSYTATYEEVAKLGGHALAKAPVDKLKWHALSRLVRFYVPEVLGAINYTKEEMDDVAEVSVVQVVGPIIDDLLLEIDAVQSEEDYKACVDKLSGRKNTFTEQELAKIYNAVKSKKNEITATPAPVENTVPEDDQTEQALEIFGGELQDDEAVDEVALLEQIKTAQTLNEYLDAQSLFLKVEKILSLVVAKSLREELEVKKTVLLEKLHAKK